MYFASAAQLAMGIPVVCVILAGAGTQRSRRRHIDVLPSAMIQTREGSAGHKVSALHTRTMKHLSALDALFLQLETPDTPMHVGSLMLLDRPAARRDPYTAIRAHIAKRIHLAPVFSRVLRFMPLDIASPLWLPAERVDLDYHIQRVTLPAPGTQAQLEHAVERLHEGTLDRDRPLWQFTVIDGLKSGQVGFYAKIHHAALDGQGGIAVAQALLDAQRKPRAVPRAAAKSAAAMPPSAAKMLGSALRNTVAQYGRILKAIPGVAQAAARTGAVALTAQPKKRGALRRRACGSTQRSAPSACSWRCKFRWPRRRRSRGTTTPS